MKGNMKLFFILLALLVFSIPGSVLAADENDLLSNVQGQLLTGGPLMESSIGSTYIENLDQNQGSMDVMIGGAYGQGGISGVCISIYGDAMGTKWVSAEMVEEGLYRVRLTDLASGTYVITSYLRDITGALTIGQTISQKISASAMVIGSTTIRSVDPETGNFEVVLSGIQSPRGVSSVCIGLHTPERATNWIGATNQGDGTYVASVSPDAEGHYSITGYFRDTKNVLCTGETISHKVTLKYPAIGKIEVCNVDTESGDYDVVLSGIQAVGGVSSACISVSRAGQATDWIPAVAKGDGTYVVSMCPKTSGEYHITGYVRDAKNRLANSETMIHKSVVPLPEIGSIEIRNNDEVTEYYEVELGEIKTIGEVTAACIGVVCSGKTTQWIPAYAKGDGTYVASVRPMEAGEYYITGYVNDAKGNQGISETIYHRAYRTLPEISSIHVMNPDYNSHTFDVYLFVDGRSSRVKNSCISVYSSSQGTRWIAAEETSEGIFKAHVDNAKDGKYQITGYVRDFTEALVTGPKTNYTMDGSPTIGELSIRTFYIPNASLEVLVTGVDAPRGIDFVSVNVTRSSSNKETCLARKVEDGVYCATIKTGIDVETEQDLDSFKLVAYVKDLTGDTTESSTYTTEAGYRVYTTTKTLGDPMIGKIAVDEFDVENNKVYVTLTNITSKKRIEGVCISVVDSTGLTSWYSAKEVTSGVYSVVFDADWYINQSGKQETNLQITGYARDRQGVLATSDTLMVMLKSITEKKQRQEQISYYCESVYKKVGYDLNKTYKWCVENIKYTTTSVTVPSNYTRLEYLSYLGLIGKSENCYETAAAMTMLARNLGYTARYMEGSARLGTGATKAHAWCEVDIEGTTYILDPEFEYNNKKSGYLIKYGDTGTYKYTNGKEVN